MSTEDKDGQVVREILVRRGEQFVVQILTEKGRAEDLSIIANAGLHPVPQQYLSGRVYNASEGNLDFSSVESVNQEIDIILNNLVPILHEKSWRNIYLFAFGSSIICMHIKLAIYRVIHRETIDMFYFSDGTYGPIKRDTRTAMLHTDQSS